MLPVSTGKSPSVEIFYNEIVVSFRPFGLRWMLVIRRRYAGARTGDTQAIYRRSAGVVSANRGRRCQFPVLTRRYTGVKVCKVQVVYRRHTVYFGWLNAGEVTVLMVVQKIGCDSIPSPRSGFTRLARGVNPWQRR